MYFLRPVTKTDFAIDCGVTPSLSLIFYGDLIDSAVVKLRKFSVFEHEVVAMSVTKTYGTGDSGWLRLP